jgi:hypothetical protein
MPKAPILRRTRLYDTLRDGTKFFHDWNIVQTTLGTMIEAVSVVRMGLIANEDPYDSSVDELQPMSRDIFYSLTNVSGDAWPKVWNTQ